MDALAKQPREPSGPPRLARVYGDESTTYQIQFAALADFPAGRTLLDQAVVDKRMEQTRSVAYLACVDLFQDLLVPAC